MGRPGTGLGGRRQVIHVSLRMLLFVISVQACFRGLHGSGILKLVLETCGRKGVEVPPNITGSQIMVKFLVVTLLKSVCVGDLAASRPWSTQLMGYPSQSSWFLQLEARKLEHGFRMISAGIRQHPESHIPRSTVKSSVTLRSGEFGINPQEARPEVVVAIGMT